MRTFVELVERYVDPELCPYPEYKGKPYYSIKYIENGEEYVGYSTYSLQVMSRFLKKYFMSSALEKQIPKKPKRIDKNATFDGNWKKVCPACGRLLIERITTPEESYPRIYNNTPHCVCGQAIDWEEE